MWGVRVHQCRYPWGQRHQILLVLDSKSVVSDPMWVLGLSKGTVVLFNHWDISPTPALFPSGLLLTPITWHAEYPVLWGFTYLLLWLGNLLSNPNTILCVHFYSRFKAGFVPTHSEKVCTIFSLAGFEFPVLLQWHPRQTVILDFLRCIGICVLALPVPTICWVFIISRLPHRALGMHYFARFLY